MVDGIVPVAIVVEPNIRPLAVTVPTVALVGAMEPPLPSTMAALVFVPLVIALNAGVPPPPPVLVLQVKACVLVLY